MEKIMNYKRYLLFLGLAIFLCTAVTTGTPPGKAFTVVIDAGHGGQDPGAVYRNIREKDIVLRLALKLGNEIRQQMPDTKVIYTRDRDVFIPLHQRAAIANSSKADLFISLHANFCGTPAITGTETFVLGLHRSEENLEVAKKENSVILMEEDYSTRYEGFDPNSPESYIMFEMVQDEYLDQSIMIGSMVQDEFKTRAARNNRGVKQAGFLVLRKISMPGVLIESGFLSNPSEAQYLNSEEGQTRLASAIFRAFRSYRTSVETRSDFRLVSGRTVEKELDSVRTGSERALQAETEPLAQSAPLNDTGIPQQITSQAPADDVWFSVQIAASTKKIDPLPFNFKGLKGIHLFEQKGMYKYLYARETSYQEILKRRAEAQKKYPEAFIVAFRNERLVPVKEALAGQKQ